MRIEGVRSVLVVAAHADDEVLGAGGTMWTAAQHGASVHTVILSTSIRSRSPSADVAEPQRLARAADAREAAAVLGATVETHDLPDNGFDTVPAMTINRVVEAAVRARRPDLVISQWANDLSLDHQLTARSVLVACRPTGGAETPTVLASEVRSSTDWVGDASTPPFAPTVFVELDDGAWDAKLRALGCYESELRSAPHARSLAGVEALGAYRGTQVGVPRAESFVLVRSVIGV